MNQMQVLELSVYTDKLTCFLVIYLILLPPVPKCIYGTYLTERVELQPTYHTVYTWQDYMLSYGIVIYRLLMYAFLLESI